jgi:hypothetical protein
MKQAAFLYDREVCVLRWRFGWLTVRWESGVRGYFQTWDAALSCVLHPVNEHVSLRIRP